MSDDEITYTKKQKVLHFGSIEEKEKERLASKGSVASGNIHKNINISASNEYLELENPNVLSKDKQLVLEEFERRKKARQIAVSTDDIEVRAHLRQINEPICLTFLCLLAKKLIISLDFRSFR